MSESTEFPKVEATKNGTLDVYSVEARLMLSTPKTIAGVTLDQRWQRLHPEYAHGTIGIPTGMPGSLFGADLHGYLGYSHAQAFRWAFHTAAGGAFGDVGLETRLVRYEWKYHHIATAVEACDHLKVGIGKPQSAHPTPRSEPDGK